MTNLTPPLMDKGLRAFVHKITPGDAHASIIKRRYDHFSSLSKNLMLPFVGNVRRAISTGLLQDTLFIQVYREGDRGDTDQGSRHQDVPAADVDEQGEEAVKALVV